MRKRVSRFSCANRLHLLADYWPVLVLAAMLAWSWRNLDFFHTLPAYGDTFEWMWALSWYGDALRAGQSITVYPLAFYPVGWYYADTFYLTLSLLPLHLLAGPAFTFNLVALLSFVVAYAGAFSLARRFLSTSNAGIVGLLFSFCGVRWFHMIGHLNILIGTALLPWILWSVERAVRASRDGQHPWRWLVLAGVLWTASMSGSMYFAFLGGLGLLTWVAGYWITKAIGWRTAALLLAVPTAVALLLDAPAIYLLYRGSFGQGVAFYNIAEVNFWGASLNSLPLPSLDHPWLGRMAMQIYRGLPYEQGAANLGLVASLLALAGCWAARRRPAWRPVMLLGITGVVLAAGLTLKWDNQSLAWPWLRPLNVALWQLGHWLKPSFFAGTTPPPPFDTAIPAPGMLLTILLPVIERARVFARFALVGSVAVFMLAAFALSLVRNRWLRLILTLLLLVELLPPSLPALPFAGISHPAFEWLATQDLKGGSVADIVAGHPYTPALFMEGESIWATRLHGKPTVGGASSIWPAHTAFLYHWLASREHAFWDPNVGPVLRAFNVRYLLLYVRGDMEKTLLADARASAELKFLRCFDPAPTGGPWSYPICVVEVPPAPSEHVNLILEDGWSGQEEWGVWAEGTRSSALWVAHTKAAEVLEIEMFPNCRPDRRQRVSFSVNGSEVGRYDFQECEQHTARHRGARVVGAARGK